MYVSSGTCEHPATGKMTYHWTLFPEKNYVQVLYIARIFRNFCPKSSICLWLSAVAATFGRWQHSLCSRCASRIAVIVLTKIRVCDYTLCSLCEETLNPKPLDQLQRGHYGAFSRLKVVPIQAATEAPRLEFAEVSLCRNWRCKLLRARHIPILKHL
jgi:hypothetical protein